MGLAVFLAILIIAAIALFGYSFIHDTRDQATRILCRLSSAGILLVSAVVIGSNSANFVDQHEIGYSFDKRTGIIKILPRSGWHLRNPFLMSIHSIDKRPMQVCINANSRVLNCKLVAFNPAGLELFIKMHGRDAADASGALAEILKSYAYDGSDGDYPFLTILRELRGDYSQEDWMKSFE
jgi:hypothetical protein